MNNKIANILKDQISDLTWIDKIAGLVQTLNFRQKTGDNITEKSYPISCDISEDACLKGAYQDLCPNSKKKSILYFEDKGVVLDRMEGNRMYYVSSLRLVCWLNLQLIQDEGCIKDVTGCGTSGDYVIEVIKKFNYVPFDVGGLYMIMIQPPSQVERSVEIFSKYSYNEEALQYLLFPFDYFSLDIETRFTIPCLT
ncbi:MAG TPA: hypothetical protein DD713_09975 [Nitrospiraceae bacterium]|nr:hypothetical protein [Nitrospiraceae bacterium]